MCTGTDFASFVSKSTAQAENTTVVICFQSTFYQLTWGNKAKVSNLVCLELPLSNRKSSTIKELVGKKFGDVRVAFFTRKVPSVAKLQSCDKFTTFKETRQCSKCQQTNIIATATTNQRSIIQARQIAHSAEVKLFLQNAVTSGHVFIVGSKVQYVYNSEIIAGQVIKVERGFVTVTADDSSLNIPDTKCPSKVVMLSQNINNVVNQHAQEKESSEPETEEEKHEGSNENGSGEASKPPAAREEEYEEPIGHQVNNERSSGETTKLSVETDEENELIETDEKNELIDHSEKEEEEPNDQGRSETDPKEATILPSSFTDEMKQTDLIEPLALNVALRIENEQQHVPEKPTNRLCTLTQLGFARDNFISLQPEEKRELYHSILDELLEAEIDQHIILENGIDPDAIKNFLKDANIPALNAIRFRKIHAHIKITNKNNEICIKKRHRDTVSESESDDSLLVGESTQKKKQSKNKSKRVKIKDDRLVAFQKLVNETVGSGELVPFDWKKMTLLQVMQFIKFTKTHCNESSRYACLPIASGYRSSLNGNTRRNMTKKIKLVIDSSHNFERFYGQYGAIEDTNFSAQLKENLCGLKFTDFQRMHDCLKWAEANGRNITELRTWLNQLFTDHTKTAAVVRKFHDFDMKPMHQ